MKYVHRILAALLIFGLTIGFTGCAKQVINPNPKYRPPAAKPAPKPQPTLEEILDDLHRDRYDDWTADMTDYIQKDTVGLPERHLRYFITEHNETPGMGDTVLDATYLLLRDQTRRNGGLSENERKLFQNFMEYSLTHPRQNALKQIKDICRPIPKDELCEGF